MKEVNIEATLTEKELQTLRDAYDIIVTKFEILRQCDERDPRREDPLA